MCGICGILRQDGIAADTVLAVRRMVACMQHRGPDCQNSHTEKRIVLGHARLAILDLSSAANQPMTSADGRFVLVYNGELYNYHALKKELESAGVIFRTASDTEVLLETFARYGKACLSRLHGMFAFGIWDKQKETLLLARDRFGQKPLFYAQVGECFLFSSEVSALFQYPNLQPEADVNAIFHYLTIQSVPAPLSAFRKVKKIPPAHFLEIDNNGSIHLERYWNPRAHRIFTGTYAEAEEELDSLLHKAVKSHLLSDVPVGIFLSGGVDSSLITALASKEKADLQTFSAGFAEQNADESAFAQQVSALCGTRHAVFCAKPDLASLLPDIITHYGEPFADPAALPLWMLCTMTRKYATVALCGDGGDDLFAGYERHLNPFLLAEHSAEKQNAERYAAILQTMAAAGMHTPFLSGAARYWLHWARFTESEKSQLCTALLRDAAKPAMTLHFFFDSMSDAASAAMSDAIQLFEIEYYLASTLMPKTDIVSMASSLEVRAPFLDADVADFALSLPWDMKIHPLPEKNAGSFGKGFETKWILKRVAARYLPVSLVYRRKMGFGVPLGEWLAHPLREMLCDTLLDSSILDAWIKKSAIQCMLHEHLQGIVNHQYHLWVLFMLALWAKYCLTPKQQIHDAIGGKIPPEKI